MSDLRPSPIAGTWYPGDAETLARSVDKQLAEAELPPAPGPVVGLAAPHAGHRYSGRVAAHAFRAVAGTSPRTVTVISPMHQHQPAEVLSTQHAAYWTPLGEIEVDGELLEAFEAALQRRTGMPVVRIARDAEHSLEIELPFLQRSLAGPFRLLPIMLRDQTPPVAQAVGLALSEVLRDQPSTLVVASSDLSHFYPAATARALDGEMLARLESFDPLALLRAEDEGVGFACGKGALAALLWACRELGADIVRVLAYATSGDVTGDDDSVVGYGAAAIYRSAGNLPA
jgi:AmmeMemoRadiSam system protein B